MRRIRIRERRCGKGPRLWSNRKFSWTHDASSTMKHGAYWARESKLKVAIDGVTNFSWALNRDQGPTEVDTLTPLTRVAQQGEKDSLS
jgi:hypothetical protein